jgi:apolipoprotein N-acyltransferase
VAATVGRGATILVTITNDAWYGDTAAPWQHLAAARFRAAELHRPVLRAAITGVSAIIRPDGGLESMLGVGDEGVLRAEVAGRADRTLYARAPWSPPLAASLVWLGLRFGARRRSGRL